MSVFYVWDLLPILAIAALLAAFFVKRTRMAREEKQLQETLRSLQSEENTEANPEAK